MRIAVGFGSNIGDRRAHLDAGWGALSTSWRPIARSSLYESAPIGPVEQDAFLNAVALFETEEEPPAVLAGLLAAERRRDRTREIRWGPRTLDLDLLLYGSERIDQPGLSVPHPALTDRRFVLEPLLEVWPAATLPDGTSLAGFSAAVRSQDVDCVGPWGIARWRSLLWTAVRTLRRREAGSG